MAKHDRRTSRGRAATSGSVSIQVPLPVLAVLGDVRQALHGLCIATGDAGAPGDAGGGPGRVVRPEGASPAGEYRVAWRERGEPRDARRSG